MLQNMFADTVKFANSLMLFRLPHPSFLIVRTLPAHHACRCSCRLLVPSAALMPQSRLTLLALLSLLHMMDAMDLVAVDWHCKGEYPLFAYCIHDKFCIDFAILSHGAWNSH